MTTQVEPSELVAVFAANVRSRRLKLGLTQQQLADRLGTYESYICAIEAGTKNPRLPNVANFAEALSTTPDALLKSSKKPKKSA